jgi:hypothetical protein
MTTKTEPTEALLGNIRFHAEQLGWLFRELGIGLQAGVDGSIRLAAYHSGAPLSDANKVLLDSLQDGWQSADQCDAID